MPALGESVTEGTVTRWLKAEGDHVAVDEPLLEVYVSLSFWISLKSLSNSENTSHEV